MKRLALVAIVLVFLGLHPRLSVANTAEIKPFLFGVGAVDNMLIRPGGGLRTIPDGKTMTIQTNSTAVGAIALKPNLTVPGDVVVGPGGDPAAAIDNLESVVIEGVARAAETEIVFNPIARPNSTVCPVGSMTLVGADYYINGNVTLSGLNLGSSEILYIGDPYAAVKGEIKVYVAGSVNLSPNSKLFVNKGYSLELYLGGNMYTAPTSHIIYDYDLVAGAPYTQPLDTDLAGVLEAAKGISIKGTSDTTDPENPTPDCTSILLQPNGDFYGTVYAPDASLTLKPSGSLYGAVVGYSVDLYTGGDFVYVAEVPEPATLLLLGLGAVMLRTKR